VGDYFAHLEIDGVLYKGVFIRQWDPTLAARIMTFTVLSEQGVAAWGKAQN
jgi:arabinan endo-1,5-alpha-L-arabinosidase